MDDTPIPLPREKSVTFHRAEHAVPVILFSGDPRRTSIIEIPDSTSQVAPEDVATEGVGGLRRCSASFKLMGFEPRVSGDAGNDSDSSESDTLFDPSASPVSPLGRNLRSGGRPGARSLEAKDVRRYRNASAVVAHKADTENRFAKWAHLTDDSELPQAFLRQCAEDFDRRLRLLSELFLFVVFLLLFVFFVVADNAVQRLYFNGAACTQPARQPIPAADLIYGPTWGPSFESTHTIVNVSDWLERVVVPAYWRRSNSTSSPTPDVFRLMLGNNIPLGGLTIRLQRRQYVTPVVTCATVSGDGNTTCTLSTAENKDTQVVGRQTKILMNDIIGLPFRSRHSFISFTPGEAGSYDWAGNTLIIPFSATYDDALDTIRRLRANATEGLYGLMDPSIQMVSVVATTFNPPLQYFARTEFLMEVPSSGVAIPSAHYWPFFLFTSEGHKGFAAYTVIFFVYSLLMAVRWLLSIPASYRRGCLLELLSTIWFYVEAANLVALFVVFVIRFVWWSESDSVVESIAVGIGSTITTNTDLINMSEQLEYMAALYRLQTELNAINTVLFFLLILKYTSLHPTLERVTIAMRLAQQSIVGLFAVFVAILLAFAICGNALFGGELGDFRSIGWSFSSLMRMLLGDSDLPAMQDVNRVLAGMFYWAFLILGLFITLNFIMAVIGEALNHSERESATVFYVPLKQQYLLFVDNVMMQVRRLKAALRVIRQHQRKIRANEARAKKNSQSVPPSRRESQDSTVAADVQAEQRNITKWMVVRELATEWKVYLGDGLRAMLVGAAAVAASDRNGGDDRKFSAVLSFLTNTRYTSIVSALDEAAALRAAGRHRVFGDAEPTQLTSAPPPEGGFTSVAMMVQQEDQSRKSMGFVEFATTVEGFVGRKRQKRQATRRYHHPTDDTHKNEPISPEDQHATSDTPDKELPSPNTTPTAKSVQELKKPVNHHSDPRDVSEVLDQVDTVVLETDFIKVLFNFWQDAANQHRMYLRSHAAKAREEVQHAAWESSTRAIDAILEEVLGARSTDNGGAHVLYPVLQAAASGSSDVIQQMNRTARSIAAAGSSVEQLTRRLSSRFGPPTSSPVVAR